jgi:hypothetical protein
MFYEVSRLHGLDGRGAQLMHLLNAQLPNPFSAALLKLVSALSRSPFFLIQKVSNYAIGSVVAIVDGANSRFANRDSCCSMGFECL